MYFENELNEVVDEFKFVECLLVVIIMGYVDYGKIILLDFFCNIKVILGEVGGII